MTILKILVSNSNLRKQKKKYEPEAQVFAIINNKQALPCPLAWEDVLMWMNGCHPPGERGRAPTLSRRGHRGLKGRSDLMKITVEISAAPKSRSD